MRYATKALFTLSAITLTSLCGCSQGSGDPQDELAGPCVIVPREPVLTLLSASDTRWGNDIPSLHLSNISFTSPGGVTTTLDLAGLEQASIDPLVQNITLDPDAELLVCTLPCALFFAPGEYAFTASSNGYAESEISVQANYAVYEGGCPGYYDVGTDITITLDPGPAEGIILHTETPATPEN